MIASERAVLSRFLAHFVLTSRAIPTLPRFSDHVVETITIVRTEHIPFSSFMNRVAFSIHRSALLISLFSMQANNFLFNERALSLGVALQRSNPSSHSLPNAL